MLRPARSMGSEKRVKAVPVPMPASKAAPPTTGATMPPKRPTPITTPKPVERASVGYSEGTIA